MTYEQIINDLKNKIYKPVYYLMGEEPYYIDLITDYIQNNILSEAEKAFNQTILYGKDCDLASLILTTKRFPMMSNYHVVIVKEAQHIKGIDGATGRGKSPKPNPLQVLLENPPKSTILVINYKYDTLDRRTKFPKTIEKNGILFDSKKLYENQLPRWITTLVAEKDMSIDPKASVLIAEHLGSDLSKIANEIEKLSLVLNKESVITPKIVEKYIGISHEYNVFELQKAVGAMDTERAYRIATYLGKNSNTSPPFLIIGFLFDYFVKILKIHSTASKSRDNLAASIGIHPAFVEEYKQSAMNFPVSKTIKNIRILREFDMKSKGVDVGKVEPAELLSELVFRLLH